MVFAHHLVGTILEKYRAEILHFVPTSIPIINNEMPYSSTSLMFEGTNRPNESVILLVSMCNYIFIVQSTCHYNQLERARAIHDVIESHISPYFLLFMFKKICATWLCR